MTYDDIEVVARRSARMGELLTASDLPSRRIAFPSAAIARARRHTTLVRWRIAAVIALLAVGAVPPVRAWIVARANSFWSSITRSRPALPPVEAPAAPAADTMGSVTFTPPSSTLTIRVATRQAAGALTIETSSDQTVTASITGPKHAAELLIMPDGLRILNSAQATAGYVVRVPASIGRVTVQIGTRAPQVLKQSDVGARRVFDLGVRNDSGRSLKD